MKNLFSTLLELDEQNEYVFILPAGYHEPFGNNGRVRWLHSDAKYYSLREQWVLPRLLREEKVDLLHSPHFLLPWRCPCTSVVTIHDVIYLIFKQDLPNPVGRAYYRFQIGFSAQKASLILTDSEFSKREIVRFLNVPQEKIRVIYPATDPLFRPLDRRQAEARLRKGFGLSGPFFFYVGQQSERKNLRRLIEAFALARKRRLDAHLVLAGPPGRLLDRLKYQTRTAGVGDAVHFLGAVSDEDLVALYSAAMALVFVSLYEGFGFPALEAMSCGTAVVTSNTTSLAEIAGDAALLVDPTDIGAISEAMERVMCDEGLRAALIEKGLSHVQRFSSERMARETLDGYRQVLDSR